MKVFAILVVYKISEKESNILQSCQDLSSFSYFQRSSVKEFMNFTSKLVVERTQRCMRSSVKEQEYLCHVYVRPDNLAGIVITDQEYPQRVGQNLLNIVLEEFSGQYPPSQWPSMSTNSGQYNKLEEYMQKYQNPSQADSMTRLQTDLDETKIILHNTLEALLNRGEKIDDLVERSEGLSSQSKMFYQTAKKTNRCCSIL